MILRTILSVKVGSAGAIAWLALLGHASNAAVLTNVPMQGGMVMPMVSYSAAKDGITVMMPLTVPQLTPLLVSNPSDRFNPEDPWFGNLDPSREGLAFSRRYGFVMSGNTDILPASREIWIRRLSGSPGLSAFRYQDTEPKAMEPIFGTQGVTNAMRWNGKMFHPLFTAPPGTNELTATFEAYLLDTATGEEVPNSSSGDLVFNWTTAPDPRPVLRVASGGLSISWAASGLTWKLESCETLDSPTWTTVTNLPQIGEGETSVSLPADSTRRFFRLNLVQ